MTTVSKKINQAKSEDVRLLSLPNLELTTIPSEVFDLVHITNLNLKGNKIEVIPDEISQLENLKVVYLDGNCLSEISTAFFELKEIEVLTLNNNQLKKIPDEIGSLINLKRLHISSNQLTELPTTIGQLEKLEHLYVSKNLISSLPDELGMLANLTQLNMFDNQLENLLIDFSNLGDLEYFEAGFNKIKSISPTIGVLKKLRRFSLFDNELSKLPKEISNLSHLQLLNVSYNYLENIDLNLSTLKSLSELHLFKNDGCKLDSLAVRKLCKRIPRYPSHYRLLIDEKQKEQLRQHQSEFKRSKIGIVDLAQKRMPSEHYKQIPYELSDKYNLVDPRLEEFRSMKKEREKSSSLLDISGNWKGQIILGREYGIDEGKTTEFETEINQEDITISGTAIDTKGVGINPYPADIKGTFSKGKINFVKQYRVGHYVVNQEVKVIKSRKGPEINYTGVFDNTTQSFTGSWEMKVSKIFFGLIPLNKKTSGTWNMKKSNSIEKSS